MHDVQIGDFVVDAKSIVLGRVKFQTTLYIGANSTILQDIKIRENSVIGAGAVVTKTYQEIVLLEKYLLNFIQIEIIHIFFHLIVY